jgi:putative endopeptidase
MLRRASRHCGHHGIGVAFVSGKNYSKASSTKKTWFYPMRNKSTAAVALGVSLGIVIAGSAPAQQAGNPALGKWGFDLSGMDLAVKPGDDFFRYVNGAWLDKAVIPADKSVMSRRMEMTDRTEARLHEILETSAAGASHRPRDLKGKVGAFYRAFMDEGRAERLGATPIEAQLAAVRAATTRDALAALMGLGNADFEAALFNVSIDIDLKQPTRYAVYLSQGGLGLPDRDYYVESQFADKKASYQAYVAQLLALLGWRARDAALRAEEIVGFETKIAEVSWTKTQDRDVNATYNPMSPAELQKLTPGFGWTGLLARAGVGGRAQYIVAENTAFPKLAGVFAETRVATLQAWQAFHIADNAAPYLSKAFTDAWFEMHEKILAGQAQQRARWKRAITAVGGGDFTVAERWGTYGTMGWAVGQLYTEQYFPPEAKAKVQALVHNLMASYRIRLENLDWMSATTKAEAIKKLDTYTIKVGYPDHPRDYSQLSISDDDLVGDVRRAGELDWAFFVDRSRGPVDPNSWDMTPQTNDAYNGSLRDIVFPAGILQPPIFDANADPAINYGAVGGVIGHELTHGFDDQGRKIDASGALRDWWTAEDAAKFTERAAGLGAQYSAFHPLASEPGVHVQGDLTMGENIADLGGLTLGLDAYRASLEGKPAPTTDGFTGAQRVFLGWAQAWCGKATDDYVKKQVVSDPHSPRRYRVNGVVRNIDAWYSAFEVKPGDQLYISPESRVHIW